MILSRNTILEQVDDLLQYQKDLTIESESERQITLKGNLHVNREAKDFVVNRIYLIEICIPIGADELPEIREVGAMVDKDYPHRYPDGKLCLDVDCIIKLRYLDNFSLISWVQEYVEPYFFSYEYFQRFGVFPFGERSHNLLGLLEAYQDLFKENDLTTVILLMNAVSFEEYRGHAPCPCGSNKKLRNCHGDRLFHFFVDTRKKEIVKRDFLMIKEELKQYNDKQH